MGMSALPTTGWTTDALDALLETLPEDGKRYESARPGAQARSLPARGRARVLDRQWRPCEMTAPLAIDVAELFADLED